MALLHHDVSEKDLNLGLFQEAAWLDHRNTEIFTLQCETKELARECH